MGLVALPERLLALCCLLIASPINSIMREQTWKDQH
jgi:hypothetical protein